MNYPSNVRDSWGNTSFTVIVTTTNSSGSVESDVLTYSVITASTSSDIEGVSYSNSNQTYPVWPYAGVSITCKYELKYRYVEGVCLKIYVKGWASKGDIGASTGGDVSQFNLDIKINSGSVNRVGTSNPTEYTYTGLINSLSIQIRSLASNNCSCSVSGDKDWNYYKNSLGQLTR